MMQKLEPHTVDLKASKIEHVDRVTVVYPRFCSYRFLFLKLLFTIYLEKTFLFVRILSL